MSLKLPALRFNRTFAFGAALILLAAGVLIGTLSEQAYRAQKLREIEIQAAIVAESVTAPLMFNDTAAAQDLANALAANPQVRAVSIYGADGVLAAAYRRIGDDTALPTRPEISEPRFQSAFAEITRPALRDGQTQGFVYLRFDRDSVVARLARYAAIGLLVIMAALVLIVAGAAQGALARANEELLAKANALADTNAQLNKEIEQRQEAEEALLQSRKMEAIGQLTGGVAHDFNNLLMVIAGGLRMLEKQNEERRAKAMEAMKQAVDRGAGLTRQLLAFARRQTLRMETIDAGRQLTGMREMLERSLRADILLDMAIAPGLPPIKTDPGQFELAVLNLAVNARDAMQKGGLLTITANAAHGGRTVEVIVKDTGTGIAPEILERIFEPYFTTKQIGEGTGLGLSQVYGFVQQSGGDVRIESEVGHGASVILSLPASDEPLPAPAPAPAIETAQRPRAVLVVEDDDGVADTVQSMLDELGHKVTRARSADEALQFLSRDGGYDFVFSDIVMPGGKSGVELAQDLARTKPTLPVLLTTGYSGNQDIDQRYPVLRKPYQIHELQAAIADLMRRSAHP
ncbi:two-component hybrid sensor and regulator [alpha proteobacterium U9-1i]|nr:two-component hybrid sensor and regulator [alpha proteobacterium U9-1i]